MFGVLDELMKHKQKHWWDPELTPNKRAYRVTCIVSGTVSCFVCPWSANTMKYTLKFSSNSLRPCIITFSCPWACEREDTEQNVDHALENFHPLISHSYLEFTPEQMIHSLLQYHVFLSFFVAHRILRIPRTDSTTGFQELKWWAKRSVERKAKIALAWPSNLTKRLNKRTPHYISKSITSGLLSSCILISTICLFK